MAQPWNEITSCYRHAAVRAAHVCWGTIFISSLCGLPGCAQQDHPSAHASGPLNTPLSAIHLINLEGKPVDLWNQQQRAATVGVFIRPDCPISNRFAPEIRRLHETYSPAGVAFYLIYVDPDEESASIRRHMSEYGYTCQALRDPKHTLAAYCKVNRTPEAVVFDKNHNIAYVGRVNDQYVELGKARAEPTKHDLRDAIEATVHGRPVAIARTKAVGCPILGLE